MKRWLIPLAMIVMLAIGTLGAYAYFDSERNTTGYISSGTLDLKLALTEDGPWVNSVTLPWNFTNMAPGDTVSGDLYMMNVGTIPAEAVTFEWNIIENMNFAEQIILTHVWDSKNIVDAIAGVVAVADGITGLPKDGKCSLAELAQLSIYYHYPYDAYTDVEPFLPVDPVVDYPQYIHMEFQFNPAAGNEFQGVSLSYGLKIIAEQVYP